MYVIVEPEIKRHSIGEIPTLFQWPAYYQWVMYLYTAWEKFYPRISRQCFGLLESICRVFHTEADAELEHACQCNVLQEMGPGHSDQSIFIHPIKKAVPNLKIPLLIIFLICIHLPRPPS